MENTPKAYIIAGASSGIGLELAKMLLLQGNTVYGISRSPGALEGRKGYLHLQHDFLSDQPLPEISTQASGLAFCPGSIILKPAERLSSQDIDTAFTLNAKAAFLFIRHYLPNIRQSGDASIVLFSTVAVQTGLPYHSAVAMAKGAVEGLARSLAAELAPAIRVNAIAPSLTDTPLAAPFLNTEAKAEANRMRHPLQSTGKAEEIALLAFHLLTSYRWATGQVFGINGGLGTIIRQP